jgi:hypothetical protein
MTLPANGDLQSTSDEAERLLAELSADHGLHPSAQMSDDDGMLSLALTSTVSAPKEAPPFVLVLIPFALIIGFGVMLNHMGGSQPSSSSSLTGAQKAPAFRGSCGSVSSSSGQWWPVLADYDRSLLATVRNRYCGDAYFNTNGRLQAASFNSPEEAKQLAERLSAATGVSFYRGKGYKP